jgi:hypothetical protein
MLAPEARFRATHADYKRKYQNLTTQTTKEDQCVAETVDSAQTFLFGYMLAHFRAKRNCHLTV